MNKKIKPYEYVRISDFHYFPIWRYKAWNGIPKLNGAIGELVFRRVEIWDFSTVGQELYSIGLLLAPQILSEWLLTGLQDVGFLLETSHDPLDGSFEVLVHDVGGQLAGGD